MEKERQMNGWVFLTIAVIYLPLVHLAGKLIDRKFGQKTKENGN